MAKTPKPVAAERRDVPDPEQFRREVRRNTGGRRVNPAPGEPQPKKEYAGDE